jgi:hypothetical protein
MPRMASLLTTRIGSDRRFDLSVPGCTLAEPA